MTKREPPKATVTAEDIENLYAVILGRRPESPAVVAKSEGGDRVAALRGFIGSTEFYENVFLPVIDGKPWNSALFTRELTRDIFMWMSRMFELDESHDALASRTLSWPGAINSIFSNRTLIAQIAPAEIMRRLDAFQSGLSAMEDEIEADAELIACSDFFDEESYSARYRLSFNCRQDAARHFLLYGWKLRYKPSLKFNTSYYIAVNQDVRDNGWHPLVHYLRYGRYEKRPTRMSRSLEAESPLAPRQSEWDDLADKVAKSHNFKLAGTDCDETVDVVVPVYRGIDDTLACIHSILQAENSTPYRLVVIDDQSPDPELSRSLERLAGLGLITLLRNDENLGFVRTVNRGMMLSQKRDVILLNSDTEVFGNWIDRLRHHAYSAEHVATVTPLSNNATIFSYPFYLKSNTQSLEQSFAKIDQITANENSGLNCTVPTGVGFCFYIRRTALDQIGFFDESLFRKGYGEENDFCMRAMEQGWDNLAAFDVFVRHTGEVSFGDSSQKGKHDGYLRLIKKHPRYDAVIAKFVQRDPFRSARESIDIGRFADLSGGRGVLMIEHGWGGGIARHIDDLTKLLDQDGIPSLVCTPAIDRAEGALRNVVDDNFPNLPKIVWGDLQKSAETLRSLNLARVHIHSVVGLSDETVTAMLSAISAAGLEYDYTIHDYSPICPRLNMVDWSGSYCASPSTDFCRICIKRVGTPFGQVTIDEWRGKYKFLIDGARKVIVPDDDVAQRLATHLSPMREMIVRPHPVPGNTTFRAQKPRSKGPRRIGLIGAIGEGKGSRILRLMCVDANERQLPIEFVLYGFTDLPEHDKYPNLFTTGHYLDADFGRLLSKTPCDVALFLSVAPESFSYTLDHAFNNLIYPVAFDIGAIARRIHETGFGKTIPLDYIYNVALLNDFLVEMEIPAPPEKILEPRRAWSSADDYYETVSTATG